MPIPIWAAVIMLTSFAPSPIARVDLSGLRSLIMVTTFAFCFGLTRHASTTFAFSQRSVNIFKKLTSFISKIEVSVSPETTTAFSRPCLVTFCCESKFASSDLIFLGLTSLTMNMFMCLLSNLHEYPILIAVSTLSPVKTHTFIPALFRS